MPSLRCIRSIFPALAAVFLVSCVPPGTQPYGSWNPYAPHGTGAGRFPPTDLPHFTGEGVVTENFSECFVENSACFMSLEIASRKPGDNLITDVHIYYDDNDGGCDNPAAYKQRGLKMGQKVRFYARLLQPNAPDVLTVCNDTGKFFEHFYIRPE